MKAKYFILALAGLFFTNAALGQTSKKKKPTKKKKSETESVYNYVDSIPMPEKFKNESIVILGHYEKMKIIPPGKPFKLPGKTDDQVSQHYVMDVFTITRFLLQDLSAIGKFSTYYFNESESGNKNITIIKKSGERIAVDLSKAIAVKETIKSDIFEFSFGKYKKIALAGLEIGDMIEFSGHQVEVAININRAKRKANYGLDPIADYMAQNYYGYSYNTTSGDGVAALIIFTVFYPHFFSTKRPTYKRTEGVHVPEFTIHLSKLYPVVKQAYDVSTPAASLPLEYSMMNGCAKPDFKTTEDEQSMHVEADTSDKVSPEYFYYENNNLPAVKYTFNLKSFERFNMHYNNTDGKGFDEDAAKLLAKKMINSKWKANAITKLYEFEKTEGKAIRKLSASEKVKYFYFWYKKNYSVVSYVLTKGEDLGSEISQYSTKLFQLFCKSNDIPYEIVMWSPRSAGPTQYAVSGDNLRWGILAHPDGKDVYLTDFDTYSEYNVPHQAMYGADVYFVKGDKTYTVRTEKFEQENDRNKIVVKTAAKLASDTTALDLKSDYTIEGELKNNSYSLVASRSDFSKYYESMMGGTATDEDESDVGYLDLYYYSSDFKTLEKQEQEKDRLKAAVDQNFELNENAKYQDYLQDQYNEEAKVEKAEVNTKGLTPLKAEEPVNINFTVDYQLKNTVNNIGKGAMVIELGRLMSQQIEFKELSDRVRKYDIDVNFQKSFDYTINFNIPQGYTPANLDDFNATVENDLCSFIATAKVENGMVVFHCVKTYKKVHAGASEWSKMTDVMDIAASMFQKKLLLEKNN